MNIAHKLLSSLEKVFPDEAPSAPPRPSASALQGETFSFQWAARPDEGDRLDAVVRVDSPLAPFIRLYAVGCVPSLLPAYSHSDEHFLRKTPGLYPDVLAPTKGDIPLMGGQWRSLWVEVSLPPDQPAGVYPIRLTLSARWAPETLLAETVFQLEVLPVRLPEQTLIHTEWFHCDCLALQYRVPVFSEEHWHILQSYMQNAVRYGINMLLTPVFTPPLDTAVNGERLTVQLVDVRRDAGVYSFGFEKLGRWAGLCRRHGVEYLEIAHLFTQWGAHATPKIMAVVDGQERRIFGWDVPAASAEYRAFLEAFLPALRTALEGMGYDKEHVYYHISDEPSPEHLDSYRAAKAQAEDLLEGCQVIDALSSLEFYRQGLVRQPVPANDHIQPFIDAQVPGLWVYYCCAQSSLVPNRFFAMESARNRIMGVLMYLYGIKGFLHWGYNFYNSKFSLHPVDPYRVTHADYAFPSGDPFLVYPGPDGAPLSSVRAEVQDDALLDLRALRLLEQLAGRAFVEELIYADAEMRPMTFRDYPRGAGYLLALRERVAAEIESRLA